MMDVDIYNKVLSLCIDVFSRHPVTEKKAIDKIKFYLSAPRFSDISKDDKQKTQDAILKKLISMKVIGDKAYVESYITSNNNSSGPDGSLLVIKKLLAKGISRDIISDYEDDIHMSDDSNSKRLLVKKFKEEDLSTNREKKLKFLYQRGFLLEKILSVTSVD